MSKISIALCTYNGAKFLSAQLDSFLRQTRLPDEIIVGDDCSIDETVSILENFAARAPFPVSVRVNETNLGSTGNFEKTILSCTGDLIFLSDQDDVWLPEKLARIEAEFERKPDVGLIFSDAELIDEDSNSLKLRLWDFTFPEAEREKMKNGKIIEVLLWENIVTGATAAFRSKFLSLVTPIPDDIPNVIHDGWITLVIAALGKIESIEEPLILYRQHRNQQLGLNLEQQVKFKQLSRREVYEESIIFHQNEKKRVLLMQEVLNKYEQFRNLRAKPSVGIFVENFLEERDQKIAHYRARKDLPDNRLGRLSPVAKELSSGRYHRFSKGFLSAAKDLIEKW